METEDIIVIDEACVFENDERTGINIEWTDDDGFGTHTFYKNREDSDGDDGVWHVSVESSNQKATDREFINSLLFAFAESIVIE